MSDAIKSKQTAHRSSAVLSDIPKRALPLLLCGLALGLRAADFTPSVNSAMSNTVPAIGAHLDDQHPLAVGDRISFRIQEDLDDPKEPLEPKSLLVADSGEIEVPYIGRVRAENKTCAQLAVELKAALEQEYYYQATVSVALDVRAKTRGRVYLVGPVRAPGAQDIPTDETLTLSKAIMRAGGFEEFADKKSVKVTRKGSTVGSDKTFVIDVARILEKGKINEDLPLEPGDLILVPEKLLRF